MHSKQSSPAKKKPAPPAKKAAKPKARVRAKPAKPQPAEPAPLDPALPLASMNDELLVQAYLANGLNATQAYATVHPRAKISTAGTEGAAALKKPHIAARVKFLSAERAKKFEVDGENLLRHASAIANADHRHLTQYVFRCCRFCHGVDHKFHRTLAEFEADREEHDKEERLFEAKAALSNRDYTYREFDEKGGPGFNSYADAAEDCPNCFGHGIGRMEVADTRKLPEDAAILFAGVKLGKDGLEILTHDKGKYSDMLFRHKGLFEADNAQLAQATSPEALALMADSMAQAREKQLAKLAERKGTGFTGD